jgi:hypothetical protein
MGWRIHRVWSTEWFHDRHHAIERVLVSLSLAESRPVEESVQGVPPQKDVPLDSATAPSVSLPVNDLPTDQRRYQLGIPYQKFNGTADRDLLIQSRFSNGLAALVVRIVDAEGPIHEDLLAERLKDVCRVERSGSNVQSNIAEAIHTTIRRKQVERRHQSNFLWKSDAKLNAFRVPNDSVRRPLTWIHRGEIELAILYLVEDQFGVLRTELGRGVARLFGIERAPAEVCDYILEIAEELVERRLLRDDTGCFVIPA